MQLLLVGADIEENLGIGMIAASAALAGHQVRVVPFDEARDQAKVVEAILAADPDVVGLSVAFQHRGVEFFGLSRELRARGYRGHLTCGGQLPSMAWREALEDDNGVDSVVLHEGERTVVELLEALKEGRPLVEVPGVAALSDDGVAIRGPGRGLERDLDALPFAARYRRHTEHYGVPLIPLMGGRGCWGGCTFCSITSCHRDARAQAGGPRLRRRSVESLADEMALLGRAAGGEAIFCFHDDNFLAPKPKASLERVRALRGALDERGLGRVALVGKCRPDSVTPGLLRELAELDVVRLYVGVENASQEGADHLGRGVSVGAMGEALEGCRRAGIFACYNLLLFEPETTLDHLRQNVAFIRAHSTHPINFCRAEAYYGTPLMRRLEAEGKLGGGYLGFTYRLEDELAELVFRVCAAAFRQRNFDPKGVANRYMGLGYAAKIIEHFYDDPDGRRAILKRRAEALTEAISLETAASLEEAIELVEAVGASDPERLTRETALLGLRLSEADGRRHAELDELFAEINAFARRARRSRKLRGLFDPARRLSQVAQGALIVGTLIAGNTWGCYRNVPDPPPPPYDGDADPEVNPGDPPPPPPPPDPVPPDIQPVDPAPPPDLRGDPPPPPPDPPPPPAGQSGKGSAEPLTSAFRDTSSWDQADQRLPLFSPPRVSISARREGDLILAAVEGASASTASVRWEGEGELSAARERSTSWAPSSPSAQLRVAVRTEGGVAVTSIRALDVKA